MHAVRRRMHVAKKRKPVPRRKPNGLPRKCVHSASAKRQRPQSVPKSLHLRPLLLLHLRPKPRPRLLSRRAFLPLRRKSRHPCPRQSPHRARPKRHSRSPHLQKVRLLRLPHLQRLQLPQDPRLLRLQDLHMIVLRRLVPLRERQEDRNVPLTAPMTMQAEDLVLRMHRLHADRRDRARPVL